MYNREKSKTTLKLPNTHNKSKIMEEADRELKKIQNCETLRSRGRKNLKTRERRLVQPERFKNA